jgi:hypothetical protein
MSCDTIRIPHIDLSKFIYSEDILPLTSFPKNPLITFSDQVFFLQSKTSQILQEDLTTFNYKKFNKKLIDTLYHHLKFMAQVIPVELSIEQQNNDIDLKNKLRQVYINKEAPSVLTIYRLNENHVCISEILLKIDSLYENCLNKGNLLNSITIYSDFILKWNKLMASTKGQNLIALFEKNNFIYHYKSNLDKIKRQSGLIASQFELEIPDNLSPIKMFHNTFKEFIHLFILPKEDLQNVIN